MGLAFVQREASGGAHTYIFLPGLQTDIQSINSWNERMSPCVVSHKAAAHNL